ncbi:MAG: response regulator [Bacteroidales bacterium]|nr:response regulator [Bacteroidales bacterium]
MINAIIVDDDHKHAESLRKLIAADFKQVNIVSICYDIITGVQKTDQLKPDLLFLDIEMGVYTGFDLLEMTEHNFEVIFTTSYQKYAIRAIKASALDYLEKPIDHEKLAEALNRYEEKSSQIKIANLLTNFKTQNENQKIALYDKGGLNFIRLNDIVRCHSDNAYTDFFILQENNSFVIQVSKGLNYFEDFLIDKGIFFRVHNQHLINVNHIKRFVKDNGGYLIMDDNSYQTIPLARARKDDFVIFLRQKGIII